MLTCRSAPLLVCLNLLGCVDVQQFGTYVGIILKHFLTSLGLCVSDLFRMTNFYTALVKERAVAFFAAPLDVVKMRVLARFRADVALNVPAFRAGHL